MAALAIKTMEIVAARIDGPARGDKTGDVRRGKEADARPRGAHVGRSRSTSVESESVGRSIFCRDERRWLWAALPTIRVIFAKQNQKAPESVRTSGIALRRLWALRFYNRWARLWFQPIK